MSRKTTEESVGALDQGHGATLDDYVDVAPAPEEQQQVVEAAVATVFAAGMKAVVEDPLGFIRLVDYRKAARETNSWENHRTSEGIA